MKIPSTFRDRPYAVERFLAVVGHAKEHNRFYRRWLDGRDEVPVIDRATFLDHNDEILSGREPTASTSGSTGVPVRFAVSAERAKMNEADSKKLLSWFGGDLHTIHLIKPRRPKPSQTVCDVAAPIDRQIDFILGRRKAGARAITTYPSNAEMLIRILRERSIDLDWVERFGLMSETVDPPLVDLIRKAFPKARVWSSYSSMEFGMIAIQCPHEPHFHHIMAQKLGVEIIGDDGRPCAEGEKGRVVITDYFNSLTPFIRYEIGDVAVREACPCGRIRYPAFGRVYGKVRTMVRDSAGRQVHPIKLLYELRDLPGMRQYQLIQESPAAFTVRVVGPSSLDPEAVRIARHHLGESLSVTVEHLEVIPKGDNGKYYYVINRLEK